MRLGARHAHGETCLSSWRRMSSVERQTASKIILFLAFQSTQAIASAAVWAAIGGKSTRRSQTASMASRAISGEGRPGRSRAQKRSSRGQAAKRCSSVSGEGAVGGVKRAMAVKQRPRARAAVAKNPEEEPDLLGGVANPVEFGHRRVAHRGAEQGVEVACSGGAGAGASEPPLVGTRRKGDGGDGAVEEAQFRLGNGREARLQEVRSHAPGRRPPLPPP